MLFKKYKIKATLTFILVAFNLTLASVTLSQGLTLNPKAAPLYGSINLSAGFDFYSLKLIGTGPVPVDQALSSQPDCTNMGIASIEPVLRVNWSGTSSLLKFISLSPEDSKLIINDPQGNWFCNNDWEFKETNAMLSFINPVAGTYDMWVANPAPVLTYPSEIIITESDLSPADFVTPPFATAPLADLPSNYGQGIVSSSNTEILDTTFFAGGNIGLADIFTDVATNLPCAGFVSSAPDYSIDIKGAPRDFLRFFFIANKDTSLLISDPQGNWFCNDNFVYFNPTLDFQTPSLGRYDIWVGTVTPNANTEGQLYVSQTLVDPLSYVTAPPLDANLPPNYGSVSLSKGFKPDPHTVTLEAGSDIDSSLFELGPDCRGIVTQAPDYRVEWSSSSDLLRFLAASSSDVTLLVLTPDEQWVCHDDVSLENTNAVVSFTNPKEGLYDIWVGGFDSGVLVVPATLYITENQANPAGF